MSESTVEVQSLTREEVAMSKVTDPFSEPYPLWHQTRLGRVEDILKEGVVSEDFARKIGKKDFSRRGNSSWNLKYISLLRGSSYGGLGTATHPAFLVEPKDTLVRAEIQHKEWDTQRPFPGELLVKHRISPREIKGIQITEGDAEGTNVLDGILDFYRRIDPSFALPIYNGNGLIWPQRISKEELRERMKE